MLEKLAELLTDANGGSLVDDNWKMQVEQHGRKVARYREYFEGRHKSFLTVEMRQMLRLKEHERFAINYCHLIVSKPNDRLRVTAVEASAEADGVAETMTAWGEDILSHNRFDELQVDLHEAVLRDGDTFIIAEHDRDNDTVLLEHNLAWDGEQGVIPVYDGMRKTIVCAAKVWRSYQGVRVVIYKPDVVAHYLETENGLNPIDVDGVAGDMGTGVYSWLPGRVPIVHFKNRANTKSVRGMSELNDAIPMQNAINRIALSMLATGELSAFPVNITYGFEMPGLIQPGISVSVDKAATKPDYPFKAQTIGGSDLVPFIDELNFEIEQLANVTKTPLPTTMGGSNQSGEALKERQVDLVGKVQSAQVKLGNKWEDCLALAADIQRVYGQTLVAEGVAWACKWKDAQVRNVDEILAGAKELREAGYEREFLRQIGKIYGYDENKIDALLEEKRLEQNQQFNAMMGTVPDFSNFERGAGLLN